MTRPKRRTTSHGICFGEHRRMHEALRLLYGRQKRQWIEPSFRVVAKADDLERWDRLNRTEDT